MYAIFTTSWRYWALTAMLLAVAFIAIPRLLPPYDLYIANMMQVNLLMAIGMNAVVGASRQFSLSNAALFGIGAYASVLFQLRLGLSFPTAAGLAVALAAVLSATLSLLAWRVTGVYLAMVTFGFSEIFQFFLEHADPLTNGPDGISAPHPRFLGQTFVNHAALFELFLPVTVAAILVYYWVERSDIGLRLMALGDSEVALGSLGYEPRRMKTIAFAIQGAYAGTAGIMFASMVGFIDPYSFGLDVTIENLTAVAIGGLGSLAGSIVGATALTLLDRILTEFPGAREFTYGAALLVTFLVFPKGLAGLWVNRPHH